MKGYIYKIENLLNGKCYIGQTIYLKKRICQHFSNGKNITCTTPLYNSMRKNGINNFTASTIVEVDCSKDKINSILDSLEVFWIRQHNSTDNGYNLTEGGDHSIRGCKVSEKTRKKRSAATKLLWKKGAYVNRDFRGNKSARFGTHPSAETRRKYSASRKGKYTKEENHFYGKKHSEESLKLMSENRRGKLLGENNPAARKVINLTTGKVFDTIKEAGKYYAIKSYWNISSACSGKQKTVSGYEWAYAS